MRGSYDDYSHTVENIEHNMETTGPLVQNVVWHDKEQDLGRDVDIVGNGTEKQICRLGACRDM